MGINRGYGESWKTDLLKMAFILIGLFFMAQAVRWLIDTAAKGVRQHNAEEEAKRAAEDAAGVFVLTTFDGKQYTLVGRGESWSNGAVTGSTEDGQIIWASGNYKIEWTPKAEKTK
jgi:hypothetical protein